MSSWRRRPSSTRLAGCSIGPTYVSWRSIPQSWTLPAGLFAATRMKWSLWAPSAGSSAHLGSNLSRSRAASTSLAGPRILTQWWRGSRNAIRLSKGAYGSRHLQDGHTIVSSHGGLGVRWRGSRTESSVQDVLLPHTTAAGPQRPAGKRSPRRRSTSPIRSSALCRRAIPRFSPQSARSAPRPIITPDPRLVVWRRLKAER